MFNLCQFISSYKLIWANYFQFIEQLCIHLYSSDILIAVIGLLPKQPTIQSYKLHYMMSKQSSLSLFQTVLNQFNSKNDYIAYLTECEKHYEIKVYRVNTMKLSQAEDYYKELALKYQKGVYAVSETQWYENQRRLFIWFVICFIKLRGRQCLAHDQTWSDLSDVFFRKDPKLLKYQYMNIIKSTGRVYWNQDEDQLLRQAYEYSFKQIRLYQKGQWNEIAKHIFFAGISEMFKTPKHCRERWQNHLDTRINKDPWTDQQDLALLTLVLENGKKWSKLSDLMLKKRTEHMIKNRYHSLITHGGIQGSNEEILLGLIKILSNKLERDKFKFFESIVTIKREDPPLEVNKNEKKFKRVNFQKAQSPQAIKLEDQVKDLKGQFQILIKEELDESKKEYVSSRGLSFVNCNKSQSIQSSMLVHNLEEKLFGSSTSQFFNNEMISTDNNWEEKSIVHTPGHFFFQESGKSAFELRCNEVKFRMESKGSFDRSSIAASMELLRPANTDMSQEYKMLVSSNDDIRAGFGKFQPSKSYDQMLPQSSHREGNQQNPQ